MDRTTKLILCLIAAGLWANAAAMLVRPALAATETDVWLGRLTLHLQDIAYNVHALVDGSALVCNNRKICP